MTVSVTSTSTDIFVTPPKSAVDILDAVYISIFTNRTYYSTLLYLLNVLWVKKEVLPTMGVDNGMRLYICPEFVLETGEQKLSNLVGVLVHEIHHILREHASRRGSRDLSLWNLACDMEINPDILDDKLHLPDDRLMPSAFGLLEGGSAEEYYEKLLEQVGTVSITVSSSLGDEGGDQESEGDENTGVREEEVSNYRDGSNSKQLGDSTNTSVCNGHCGGVVGGENSENIKKAGEESGVPPVSEARIEVALQATADAVMQEAVSGIGRVPAWLERWAEKLNEPVVNWRQLLATAVIQATNIAPGVGAHTYSRPSRRHKTAIGQPILPRSITLQPKVGVVIDTSGSMSQPLLETALSEVKGVLRASDCRNITVFACDTEASTAQKVYSTQQIKLTGGGGTDMGVGIQAALDADEPSEVIIVLTDGYTPWPDTLPPVPVVVGLVGGYKETPDWATTIVIEDN